MLTKTIKFDADVVDILRSKVTWNDDGTQCKIAPLDRPSYEKVNKALAAMGGKWVSGKTKAHVFPTDPRPQVDGLLESGVLTVERDGFFETSSEVLEQMLEMIRIRANCLEPSAGMGAIADHIPLAKSAVICVEKNPQRAEALRAKGYTVNCTDFLQYDPMSRFETIVMNPPFEEGQDMAHVRHAYDLLTHDGEMVAVMSEGAFYRKDAKAVAFRKWLEKVSAGRGGSDTIELDAGAFKSSGTGVKTRIVAIRKE